MIRGHRTNRLRIGIDFDGTISTWGPAFTDYLQQFDLAHGHQYSGERSSYDYWPKVCPECWTHFFSDHGETGLLQRAQPVPGMMVAIATLREHFDLFVITSRRRALEGEAWRWLHRHGLLVCFQDVISTTNKRATCEALGINIHIDDSGLEVTALQDSPQTVGILFDAPYNQGIDAHRAGNWAEVLAMVFQVYGDLAMEVEEQARFLDEARAQGLAPLAQS